MDSNSRELVLLSVAVSVPLVLFLLKRQRLLLGWVCLTLFVQLFDTNIITNLPAGRIVGLIYLPHAIVALRIWIKLSPVKAWMVNYLYLVVLAIVLGWVFPWPDTTMLRPFSLTAQGRSLIYTVRLLSDLSLAIFIADQLRSLDAYLMVARAMILGATVSSLFAMLYMFTGFDLAVAVNGFENEALLAGRAHGLSGEPRDFGLACAYGIMFLLVGKEKLFRLWPIMLAINLIGMIGSSSTSAVALLAGGLTTGWFFFSNRTRGAILSLLLIAALVTVTTYVFFRNQFDITLRTIEARLDPDVKLAGIPPGTFGQEVAYRLDVFDASAMLFMLDQPFYVLVGTGPGLVSLPASLYIPPGLYSAIWTPEVGINNPPFHGILLEIANSGLVGLALWIFQLIVCWKALRWMAGNAKTINEKEQWDIMWGIFIIGSVLYLIQVSISPVWSVILAIGWAATRSYCEMNEPLGRKEMLNKDPAKRLRFYEADAIS